MATRYQSVLQGHVWKSILVLMRAHRCALYHEEKAKGCQEVIAPVKGTVMMLREGAVAEQQAAPVTQGNRSRRGQG